MGKKSLHQRSTDVVIGMFYQTPTGKVIFTTQGGRNGMSAHEDGKPSKQYSYEQMGEMRALPHIRDFPNAKDPKLPYVFDLMFDIKYVSELPQALDSDPDVHALLQQHVPKEVVDLSKPHGIAWDRIAQHFRAINNAKYTEHYEHPNIMPR